MLLSKTFGQLKTSFPYVFYQHFLINRERFIVSTDAIHRVGFPGKNKKIFQEAITFFVTVGEIRVAKSACEIESSLYLTKSLSFMKTKLVEVLKMILKFGINQVKKFSNCLSISS